MPEQILRGYADAPQGQVHYRAAGAGPAILLLHQNGMTSACFERLIPLLADDHRVVAFDDDSLTRISLPLIVRLTVVATFLTQVLFGCPAEIVEALNLRLFKQLGLVYLAF